VKDRAREGGKRARETKAKWPTTQTALLVDLDETSTDEKKTQPQPLKNFFQVSSSLAGRTTPQVPARRENSGANASTSAPFQTPAVGRGKRKKRFCIFFFFFNSRDFFLFPSLTLRPEKLSLFLSLPGPAFAARNNNNHATAAGAKANNNGFAPMPPNTIQRLFSAERALGSQSLDTPGGAGGAGGGGAAPMATTAAATAAAAPWQQLRKQQQQHRGVSSRASRPPLVPPPLVATTTNNLSRFPPSRQAAAAAAAAFVSSSAPPPQQQQPPAVEGFSISYSQSYARAPSGALPPSLIGGGGGGTGAGPVAAAAATKAAAATLPAAHAATATVVTAAAVVVISSDDEDEDDDDDASPSPLHAGGLDVEAEEIGARIRRGRRQRQQQGRRRRRRDSDAAPPLACGCSPTARCDCAAEELAAKAAALDDIDSDGEGGDGATSDSGGGGGGVGDDDEEMSEGKREGRQQRRRRQRQRPPTRSVTPELAPREDGEEVEEIAGVDPSAATGATATTATASDLRRSPSCSNASTAALAAAPSRQLFGIFRPVSQIKRLHIVRHGQSTYNEAVETRGSAFADPRHIFDAPLTPLGRRQAGGDLRRELSRMNLKVEDTLWVVSPLTRALETFALGCPFWEEGFGLGKGEDGGGESGEGKEEEKAKAKAKKNLPRLSVVVRREISERLCTSGDIGLPASQLRRNWPALASLGALDSLPERWWHGGPEAANCSAQQRFTLPERAHELEGRVASFRRWLHSRPERNVVVVGHSVYFRSLQRSCSAAGGGRVGGGGGGGANGAVGGGPRRGSGGKGAGGGAGATTLKNCEVATLYF